MAWGNSHSLGRAASHRRRWGGSLEHRSRKPHDDENADEHPSRACRRRRRASCEPSAGSPRRRAYRGDRLGRPSPWVAT
ncbi:hypothetical protein TIFTF001_026432 [Ficus carica]|uniref:Uncharacterized protein n=1 Tax=Ficus carica TaxID=3494 RepID=A0AA88DL94_FICCA|nr:hypothetical protein TIFTF001_026432 [Ficus carica]